MALLDLSRAPHGGRLRLLPENRTEPRITPRLLIYHSMVGSIEGTYGYFLNATVLESTLGVSLSGQVEQWMDTERQADANYHANQFATSVETEDRGDPDTQPWTDAQLDALAWIAWECHRLHRIPLRRADRWDGSGVGYHTMFGAPSPWTPVRKSCPGEVRIQQFDRELMPRITAGPEDDMPLSEADLAQIEVLVRKVLNEGTGHGQRTWSGTSAATLDTAARTYNYARDASTRIQSVEDEIAAVRQLLDGGRAADQTTELPKRS